MDKLLNIEELSQKLHVPKSWLYVRTRKTGPGAIPKVKLGRYVRFQWEDIEKWIRSQQRILRKN